MGLISSVIMLEFNELTPTLMQRYIAEGRLPNFKKFHDAAHVFRTHTDEESVEQLEPWVQWVTCHSGVPSAEHGVYQLAEGNKYRERRVWDVISQAGKPVWLCGSMNIFYQPPINGCVLPDPWCGNSTEPHPSELKTFFKFVQANVQEHTRPNGSLNRREALQFLWFMLRSGLSGSTVAAVLRQSVRESLTAHERWKRSVLLDRLQFDVFVHYYRKVRPALATFFLNSTAHLQHRFWRYMEPEPFEIKPTVQEITQFGGAIRYGYEQMDELIGRFLRLQDGHTAFIFVTALSQQPHLAHEKIGGKLCYRPYDFEAFLHTVGVTGRYCIEPIMSEQFHLRFDNESAADQACKRLAKLSIGEEQMMKARREGCAVLTGCRIHHSLADDSLITGVQSAAPLRFYEFFYKIDAVKGGRHHPEGMLWILTPGGTHRTHDEGYVSLCSIAPTILRLLALPTPRLMQAPPLFPWPGRAQVVGR